MVSECAGCGQSVRKSSLAEHHITCAAIAAALQDGEDEVSAAVAGGSAGIYRRNSALSVFTLNSNRDDISTRSIYVAWHQILRPMEGQIRDF